MTNTPAITVFHDGDCPVCRAEIRFYARIDKTQAIDWRDITRLADDALPTGKTRSALLGRFHVRDRDGEWHIGVDAFARIWQVLPGFRHVAWIFSVPGIRQLAEAGYRGFLGWQQRHRRARQAAGKASHAP
ncbi:thiol-disulfide oxidoreductase DCC family protein [Stappia stellulata]|uniref:thiol-disulfide oxidoreductase DCC family protein n=1 Tax=Stappia stellulata TaxID=71235 RepID=UPI000418D656|nr:DUF393 domain-containing protein [Stappia stellulata]